MSPQCWFLTGSQGLYGPEIVEQVDGHAQQIVAALNDAEELRVEVVWKPVLTDAAAIHRVMLEANSDPDCIGADRLDAHLLAGQDVDRRPRRASHTAAAPAHPGRCRAPWAEIDMDFMNLNQAAHGDREFGYIQTRLGVARKTVAGHVSDPGVRARIGAWQRAAVGYSAIRRLRLARFGDNMRDVAVTEGDKVEAQLKFGVSVNTYGVNDLVARSTRSPTRKSTN